MFDLHTWDLLLTEASCRGGSTAGTHQYHDGFASATDISAVFSSLFSWAGFAFVFVCLWVISNLCVSREPKQKNTIFNPPEAQ